MRCFDHIRAPLPQESPLLWQPRKGIDYEDVPVYLYQVTATASGTFKALAEDWLKDAELTQRAYAALSDTEIDHIEPVTQVGTQRMDLRTGEPFDEDEWRKTRAATPARLADTLKVRPLTAFCAEVSAW